MDDSLDIQTSLKFLLEDEGYQFQGALNPGAALSYVKENDVSLVLLDMNFTQDTTSGKEGLSAIESLKALDSDLPIIVMTGWATLDLAVEALKKGAADFVEKPWDDERLARAIKQHVAQYNSRKDIAKLAAVNERLSHAVSPDGYAPVSAAKQSTLAKLKQLAQSDMNILLTGENGTGKSHYAKLIHQQSLRCNGSFITLNMGAITDALFNSELFGHKKGAFTDAKTDRIGAVTLANDGTLFLDEIANLSFASQAKLLHVLEERHYTAVGSSKVQLNTARVISATNSDLKSAIAENRFRQDLYYRLNTVEVEIPPLRQCQEDIVPLAEYFLGYFSKSYAKSQPALNDCAKAALRAYSFPGNVRELKHLMERVLFTCNGKTIFAFDLNLTKETPNGTQNQLAHKPNLTLDEIIENALLERLRLCDGNATLAAKSLGMSRSAWYRKMAKYE